MNVRKRPKILSSCGLGSTAQHRAWLQDSNSLQGQMSGQPAFGINFDQQLCPKGFWLAIGGLGLPGQAMEGRVRIQVLGDSFSSTKTGRQ